MGKIIDGARICTKCEVNKNLTEYYYNRNRKCYMASCKKCNNKQARLYQKNKDYQKTEKYVFYQRAYEIKRSSKNRGIVGHNSRKGLEVMDNLREHLIELWDTQNKMCYYTNILMSLTGSHDGNRNAFTVDRVDSSRGYIKGNIVLCTNIANRVKQDLTLIELYDMCGLIQKNIKKYLDIK